MSEFTAGVDSQITLTAGIESQIRLTAGADAQITLTAGVHGFAPDGAEPAEGPVALLLLLRWAQVEEGE